MSKYFTKIAHHKEINNTICIITKEIDKILASIKDSYGECPIEIVAIFTPKQQGCAELHTNWLIHYFESRVNEQSEEVCRTEAIEYFIGNNFQDGIYLWNKSYKLLISGESEKRICLVMYIVGNLQKIKHVALKFCTHAIVFGGSNQNREEDPILQSVNPSLDFTAKIIHIPKLDFDPNNTEETLEAADTFFQVLEKELFPKLALRTADQNSTKRLNLGNFQQFIKATVKIFNETQMTTTDNEITKEEVKEYKDESFTSIPSVPLEESIVNKNSEGAQDGIVERERNQIPEKHSENSDSEEEIVDESIVDKEVPIAKPRMFAPCNPDCIQFQVNIENLIIELLKKETTIFNFTTIMHQANKYIEFDGHDLLLELAEIFRLLNDYTSNLRNMFDNYVCFFGPEDEALYSKLIETASGRVLELLKSKRIHHTDFLNQILKKCMQETHQIFYEHNQLIIENEKQIASEIYNRVLVELDMCLDEHIKNETSVLALDQLYTSLKLGLITLMTRASDHGGRLNQVQTVASKSLISKFSEVFTPFSKNLKEDEFKRKWPVKYAIYLYQRQMRKIFANPMKFNLSDVSKHHFDNVNKVITNLQTDEEKSETIYLLGSHITYIVSLICEKIQIKKIQETKRLNTLTIYIGPNWLQMYMTSKDGVKPITYHGDATNKCPNLILLDKHGSIYTGFEAQEAFTEKSNIKQSGEVHDFAGNTVENEKISNVMLTGFFHHLKQSVENFFKKQFPQALLIVPSWYQSDYFDRLYHSTEAAGFLQTYIVKESSLIAKQVLDEASKIEPNSKGSLAVVVIVNENKVSVEVYSKSSDTHDSVIMLAQTLPRLWDESEQVSSDTSKKLSMSKSITKDKILNVAYRRAMSLVQESLSARNILNILLTDTDEWLQVFNDYFQNAPNAVLTTDPRNTYTMQAVEIISKDPTKVRQMYIDYLRVDSLEPNVSFKPEVVNRKIDQPQTTSKNPELEKKIVRKKQTLLKRCESIREQMVSGKVRVGRLFQKDINESLDRAEEIAQHISTNLKDVEDQESEINELVAEHNFYEAHGSTRL